ncbi:MAG: hypothetical protein LUF28_03275 [Clostridiales bacterium]|nr:hypothetical protein [Clostridiales bacterium]
MTNEVALSALAFRLAERINAAQAICTAMTDSDIDPAEWLPGLEFVLSEIERESGQLKTLSSALLRGRRETAEEAAEPSD